MKHRNALAHGSSLKDTESTLAPNRLALGSLNLNLPDAFMSCINAKSSASQRCSTCSSLYLVLPVTVYKQTSFQMHTARVFSAAALRCSYVKKLQCAGLQG